MIRLRAIKFVNYSLILSLLSCSQLKNSNNATRAVASTEKDSCSKIINVILNSKEEKLAANNFSSSVKEELIKAEQLARIMYLPYKTFYSNKDGLEVVGSFLSEDKLALSIFQNIEKFDEAMIQQGFTKPRSTRILLNDKPIIPSMLGPFSLKLPSINIWRGKFQKVIALNPQMWNTSLIGDKTVLFHERTHSLLYSSYGRNSFINTNNTFQEAMADYFSASFANQPHIGMWEAKTEKKEAVYVRNISKKYFNLVMASATDYHGNSLYLSSLLWSLREKIGNESVRNILKPLIENLNGYRASFLEVESAKLSGLGKESAFRNQLLFIYDFEYFLAILKKTLVENNELDGVQLIDTATLQYNLRPADIDKLITRLKFTAEEIHHDSLLEVRDAMVVIGYATGVIGTEGALIYSALKDPN
jgi:hypothetical protein